MPFAEFTPEGRFPRTRGDGPYDRFEELERSMFPPHARGWTLVHEIDGLIEVVSPARAGMDPRPLC